MFIQSPEGTRKFTYDIPDPKLNEAYLSILTAVQEEFAKRGATNHQVAVVCSMLAGAAVADGAAGSTADLLADLTRTRCVMEQCALALVK